MKFNYMKIIRSRFKFLITFLFLGIIIYGMLIALIVPPAKESKSVLAVVLMALGMSIILECIPAVKANLSAGWIIIICALVTATIGAILFPVEEKEESVE